MATIKELSDGGPDGTRLGQSSSDLIGFYGLSTPVARRAAVAAMTTLTLVTIATADSGWMFKTSDGLVGLFAQVTEIRNTLVGLGLHGGGA